MAIAIGMRILSSICASPKVSYYNVAIFFFIHCYSRVDQLSQLRNANIGSIICDNSDEIAKVPKNPFNLLSKRFVL